MILIFLMNHIKQFTLLSGLLIQVRVCHLVGWITGRWPGHRGLQWTSIHVASSTTVCKEIHIIFTNLFFQLNMLQSKKKLSYKDSLQKTLKESWFGNLPISNEDMIIIKFSLFSHSYCWFIWKNRKFFLLKIGPFLLA